MKKMLFGVAVALMASACHNQEKGYTILGNLSGEATKGKVYLEYLDSLSNPVVVDSAELKDGQFMLTGKVDAPAMHYLVIDLNQPGEQADLRNKKFRTMVYMDNATIEYKGDVATLPGFYYAPNRRTEAPVVSGSPTHDLYLAMNASMKAITDTLSVLSQRYMNEYHIPELQGQSVDNAVGISLVREEMKWSKQLLEAKLKFIKEHSASIVALDQAVILLSGLDLSLTSKQIDEMISWFQANWKGTPELKRLEKAADAVRWMAIGEKYKDIEVLNRKGEKVKLSSLIPENEYVMLEFWASWCGPCRAEIPHLRKVKEKYKDFTIVSISVDEKEADWQKALKEERMDWTQGRLEGGIYGDVAREYNIVAVPMCLILDKQGCFYKSNMRGAYLDAFLEDLHTNP